jgi:hypothetical protein
VERYAIEVVSPETFFQRRYGLARVQIGFCAQFINLCTLPDVLKVGRVSYDWPQSPQPLDADLESDAAPKLGRAGINCGLDVHDLALSARR